MNTLETPCLVLDPVIMTNNIRRMHERLGEAGVPLRPHVKTTKCLEVAELMTRGQPGGIAVSTLKEAEYFAAAGFKDIIYAVAVGPNKIEPAVKLCKSGVNLALLIDNIEAARLVGEAARRLQVCVDVFLEVDVDGHRSGVSPAASQLVPLAQAIHSTAGLFLRGLLTHAGSAYDCTGMERIAEVAERERTVMLGAMQSVRAAGAACAQVSVGSTPTALAAGSYKGLTEVRAGVFPFNDLMQVGLGVCSPADISLSVLCSVIGHYPPKHRVIVDAGWTALSQEMQSVGSILTYGRVCNLEGKILEDLAVTALNQEHGIITRLSGASIDVADLPLGTRLRILPIHACSTATLHDRYHVIDERGHPSQVWRRFSGWSGH